MSITETFSAKTKSNRVNKLASDNWIDSDEPQVLLFQGMRNSGKGVAVDATAEKLYNEGLLIIHIWGARSFENLYWAINKNCGKHFSKMKQVIQYYFDKNNLHKFKLENEKEYLTILDDSGFIKIHKSDTTKHIELTKKGISFLKGNELHCKCHKAYPIVWIVPDYIEVNQESLDRFNGAFLERF